MVESISHAVCTLIQGLSGQRDDWSALIQQLDHQAASVRPAEVDEIVAQLTLPLHTIGFASLVYAPSHILLPLTHSVTLAL